MRGLLTWVLGLVLRVFFRRIEVDGTPPTGAAIYVLNHPNALVDPVFILCRAPQNVSFLAKAPLFSMPVLGAIVRAFDSLPVYRRQDLANPADNRQTLDKARQILRDGGAIAVFPEGTTHSDSKLKPLKTGAARIALGARSSGEVDVPIVPVGLHYTDKAIFRSQALISYGEPIDVPQVDIDDAGEPRPEPVRELTGRIAGALGELVVEADSSEALHLVEHADHIMAAEDGGDTPLSVQRDRRQALVAGYASLRHSHPARLRRLQGRIRRYVGYLSMLGLDPEHPTPQAYTFANASLFTLRNLFALAVLAPLALIGFAVHAPAYYLLRLISWRLANDEEEMPATIKVLGSMLLFPLTWVIGAALAVWMSGSWWAALGLLAGPPLGYLALMLMERLESIGSQVRALRVFLTRRRLLEHLSGERAGIRDEILALAELLEAREPRADR